MATEKMRVERLLARLSGSMKIRGRANKAGSVHTIKRQSTIIASDTDKKIVEHVHGLTMTSAVRVHALLDAVEYIVSRNLDGAFAECGVWRGGSVLAMILKLQSLGINDRDIYLYDTFDGMTEPTDKDTSPFEQPAKVTWSNAKQLGQKAWGKLFDARTFGEEQVRELLLGTGYPEERLHIIKGSVEATIPAHIPEGISLLRLDTDWYESTYHELVHLYPKIAAGGVLIIDDYGYWEGCRRAVDEYFAQRDIKLPLLARIDFTGRIAVKP